MAEPGGEHPQHREEHGQRPCGGKTLGYGEECEASVAGVGLGRQRARQTCGPQWVPKILLPVLWEVMWGLRAGCQELQGACRRYLGDLPAPNRGRTQSLLTDQKTESQSQTRLAIPI